MYPLNPKMKLNELSVISGRTSEKTKQLLARVVLLATFGGLVATAGYFYWQYRALAQTNPATEVIKITKYINRFMDLPLEPLPTMATVTEKDKLKEQGFFKNAENGDKVLIYLSAGKAILYRPATKKIIDVAPITQTDTPTEVAPKPTTGSSAKVIPPLPVVLLNGTNVSGVARSIEQQLTQLNFDVNVVSKGNANSFSHVQTTVFDSTGSHSAEAQQLATLLGGVTGELPPGEIAGETQGLIVVIGSNSLQNQPTAPNSTQSPEPAAP